MGQTYLAKTPRLMLRGDSFSVDSSSVRGRKSPIFHAR
jgi:hypothetical protein